MATITSILFISILAMQSSFRFIFAYLTLPIRYPIGLIISVPTVLAMGLALFIDAELCRRMANVGEKVARQGRFVRFRAAIGLLVSILAITGLLAVYFVTPLLASTIFEKFKGSLNGP